MQAKRKTLRPQSKERLLRTSRSFLCLAWRFSVLNKIALNSNLTCKEFYTYARILQEKLARKFNVIASKPCVKSKEGKRKPPGGGQSVTECHGLDNKKPRAEIPRLSVAWVVPRRWLF